MSPSVWWPRVLERLCASTFLAAADYLPEVPSTNDAALSWTGALPALFVAGTQTDGRGRRGHQWFSTEGSLTFSLAVNPAEFDLGRAETPIISLYAALAVSDLAAELLPAADVKVKWPNDVYLDGGKVSGILVESRDPASAVIGIGINVNNDFSGAPEEVASQGRSLAGRAGRELLLPEVLERAVLALQRQLQARKADLPAAWRPRCMLSHRPVLIEQGDARFEGVCRGIDAHGALLIEQDGVLRAFNAGVVLGWG